MFVCGKYKIKRTKTSRITKISFWVNWLHDGTIYLYAEDWRTGAHMKVNQEFHLGHVKSEMPIRHPKRNVKLAIKHKSRVPEKPRMEIHLKICLQSVFKSFSYLTYFLQIIQPLPLVLVFYKMLLPLLDLMGLCGNNLT